MLDAILSGGVHSAVAWVIGFLVAIGVHEFAHARAAYALGDSTAADLGRMTPNPFKHLSLWGSLFLLFFGFGWSQPVPIDTRNFRLPRRDHLLTALAGPLSNVVTAAVFGLAAQFLPAGTRLPALAGIVVFINLLLAFFNLIPVPPLDGSTVLPYIFPHQPLLLFRLQQQGFLLLVFLLLADQLTGGSILGTLVARPATALAQLFLRGASPL